jgi:uncharacterized protein (DUF362 family)
MTVFITKVKNIEEDIMRLLQRLKFHPEKKTVIKPNVCGPYPENSGIVTRPSVVRGIIRYLKDKGTEKIIVGESSSFGLDTKYAFKISGYEKLCKEERVELVDFNECERKRIRWKYGRISLPKILFKASYINIAKMKTHIQTTVSLALKNQKGLLLPGDKKRFHLLGLHEAIAELARVIKPEITTVDAIDGIERNGPGRMGRKKKVGLIIAGDDVVSVDSTCCKIMRISPYKVKHIKLAWEKGVGKIEDKVIGELPLVPFELPKKFHKVFNTYLWWSDQACSGCSSALGEARKLVWRKPSLFPKVFWKGVIKRVDFLIGKGCKVPKDHGEVVCIGKCTQEIAKERKFRFVSGCPPRTDEILRALG